MNAQRIADFSKDAYANMVKDNPYSDNKELLIIPDAVYTDLYAVGGTIDGGGAAIV